MPKFEIVTTADGRRRLVAPKGIEPDEFQSVADAIGEAPRRYRKVGFVAARPAADGERVETHWNGKETSNTARKGDWVATNLAPDRSILRDKAGNANTYVIRADAFPRIYARDAEGKGRLAEGDIYRSISTVRAVLLDGGFELLAPWGEVQSAPTGYLLDIGTEVYGNNSETFGKTYVPAD